MSKPFPEVRINTVGGMEENIRTKRIECGHSWEIGLSCPGKRTAIFSHKPIRTIRLIKLSAWIFLMKIKTVKESGRSQKLVAAQPRETQDRCPFPSHGFLSGRRPGTGTPGAQR